MMKMIVVVFACLVAASSAQLLTSLGSTTWQQESTAQQHSPWAASASTRSQVHGPDATLLAAAPVAYSAYSAPVVAAAPVAYTSYAGYGYGAPLVHHAAPVAYLRR